jgi:hypothetical protein
MNIVTDEPAPRPGATLASRPPGPVRELAELALGVLGALRDAPRAEAGPPAHASFDPVRVEAEFYDAIYGRRSGTVENIAPVAAPPRGKL